MPRLFPLAFGVCALFSVTSALAAPAEQIDCVHDRLSASERNLIGAFMLESMADDDRTRESAEGKTATAALDAAMERCTSDHAWTKNEGNAAFSYTSLHLMAAAARNVMEEMGGDSAAADLFYAQNKYKILEEEAAGRSSEEWANLRLVEMGFAPKGARAFDAVWLYLGLLFQADAERDVFVSGKTPGWTK